MAQGTIQLSQTLLLLCLAYFALGALDTSDQRLQLVSRQSSKCGNPEFLHCGGDPPFPDDFCCPPTSSCINIDRSHDEQTIICCPKGFKCTKIRTITCDISQQNATYDPSSLVKSERLWDSLPKCGGFCCPHGYTCKGDACELIEEDAKTFSYSSTATPTATSTSSSSGSDSASSSTATSSNEVIPMNECPQFSRDSIVVGFFPGMAVGFILAAISYCVFKKYRNRISPPLSPNGGSPIPTHKRQRSNASRNVPISDPIPTDIQDSVRTDFLRHMPAADGRPPSRFARTGARVRNLFTPTPRQSGSDPPPLPVTPPNRTYSRRRERTSEDHQPYDGSETAVRKQPEQTMLRPSPPFQESRPTTTFTDMMERVGFQNERGNPVYRVTDTPPPPPVPTRK